MGRGYSANRSATSRPSNKDKRPRSVSLARMKDRLGVIAAQAQTKEELAKAIQHMDEDDDMVPSEDEAETVRRPDVMTKYKMCGAVTDEAVQVVAAACVAGATTWDLCAKGDAFVLDKAAKMFQKSKSDDGHKMKKGLCFPTTVSVNNVLCNHSPAHEREAMTIKNGDVVKIAVSVHFDGYPTTSAVTIIVGEAANLVATIPPEQANLLAATHYAIHGMIRLAKPGMDNQDITDYIAHVAKTFGVETVEGVLSNRTKRWILDGNECIIARRILTEDPQQNVGDCVIGAHEVWTLDVAFTTATSYRMKAIPADVNIFRRNQVSIEPRNQAAQDAVKEIRDSYMCFPFTPLRMANPLRIRLGIVELRKNDMLDLFPALASAKNTFTARHSCTIAVTDKRVNVLSGMPAATLSPLVLAALQRQPTADIQDLMSEDLLTAEKPKKGSASTAAKSSSKRAAAADGEDAPIDVLAAKDDEDGGDDDAELPTRNRKAHRSGV